MTDGNIFDLTGRIALVTGGSRGLGRAMARAVAVFGANIIVAARAQDKIAGTLEELKEYGGTCDPQKKNINIPFLKIYEVKNDKRID